jgi:hypothetical protein
MILDGQGASMGSLPHTPARNLSVFNQKIDDGELKSEPTVAKFATVQNEEGREVSKKLSF